MNLFQEEQIALLFDQKRAYQALKVEELFVLEIGEKVSAADAPQKEDLKNVVTNKEVKYRPVAVVLVDVKVFVATEMIFDDVHLGSLVFRFRLKIVQLVDEKVDNFGQMQFD